MNEQRDRVKADDRAEVGGDLPIQHRSGAGRQSQVAPEGGDALLAKDQPADVGQHKHEGDPQNFRAGKCLERRRDHPGGKAINQDEDSIVQAPEDKVPRRAVPEAGQKKDDQNIGRRPRRADVGAAERDVNVVANPGGQRDVPAPPEIRRGFREVGVIEVLDQLKSEQSRCAAGDVGVCGEIGVNLHAESKHARP